MVLEFTVLSETASKFWEGDFTKAVKQALPGARLELRSVDQMNEPGLGNLVFVSADSPRLDEFLAKVERVGRAVILVSSEGDIVPGSLLEGLADDVLVHPFRLPELLGKLRIFEQILVIEEITKANETFSGLIDRLKGDLQLAERLQKSKFPTRFKDPKGFKIKARYLAGIKSGGEFFDLAESASADRVSLLLSDSSSYGLSSAVLSVLMRVAAKLTGGDRLSCFDTVKQIYDELMLTLGEKDQLSLFFGTISRKDLSLSYLNLGTSQAYLARKGAEFRVLENQGEAISRARGLRPAQDIQTVLEPEDRLVLLSDGFLESVGGTDSAIQTLNRFRHLDATDALNEFVFSVKSKLGTEEEMPAQDCTGIVVDVDSRVIRIARR